MSIVLVSRVAAIVIAAIAVARCLMTLLPETWFDVDPMLDSAPATGLPPHWLMIFDACLIAAAALGLAAESWARRGGSGWLLILVVPPLYALLFWSMHGGHQVQAAVPWLAAVMAAVALAHLCRDRVTQRIVLAVLLAVCGPLILQGLVQWGWTVPDTMAWFAANRDEALAAIGLTPGSPAAAVYERRLSEGASTGWFSSPNLLATVLAACAVAWLAMVVAAKRRGASVVIGAIGLVTTLGAAAVVGTTMSTGGLLVLAIGLVLVGLRVRTNWPAAVGGWLAIGLPSLAAVAAIIVVWVMPADTTIGGLRSLVIRGQYAQGAVAIFMEHPETGVGPAGFQDAWVGVRPIGAPEEVTSSHAMIFDWLAMLGVAGLSWVALVGVLLWRAGVSRWADHGDRLPWVWLLMGSGLVIALTLIGLESEWALLDPAERFVRVCGLALVPILACVGASCMRGPLVGWGVTVAIIVLFMQAQVEMTIFNAASGVLVLALLGAAAPWKAREGRAIPALFSLLAAILCVIVIAMGVRPWIAQDQAVQNAAQILIDGPPSAETRDLAGRALTKAWDGQRDPRLLVHAADQHLAASSMPGRSRRDVLMSLSQASSVSQWAHTQGLLAGGYRHLEAVDGLAVVTGNPKHAAEAIAVAETLTREDPGSPQVWVMLARLLAKQGDAAGAAEAWGMAIRVDEANVIDPLQRLPASVRTEAEAATSATSLR